MAGLEPVTGTDYVELPAGTGKAGQPALAANVLTLWQVLVYGFAVMGVAAALAYNSGAILYLSGYGSWLSILLATVLMLFIAAPILIFSRRHAVTGSLMSLLAEELGARWSPIPAAALLGGYVVALMSNATSTVLFAGSFCNDLGWMVATHQGVQVAVIAAAVAAAVGLTVLGIAESMKVTICLGLACLPLVLIVSVAAVIKGGVDLDPQIHLQGLTRSGLASGVYFALSMYVGFESLTALGKETQDARRGLPIVLLVLIVVTATTFFVGALFQIPILMRHRALLDAGSSPNAVLAGVGGVQWTDIPTDALLTINCLAGQIGFTNGAARVFATMARDGGLPRWVGKIHPTQHTPMNAAYLIGGLNLVLSTAHLLFMKEGALAATAEQAVLVSNLWLVAYFVTCIGGVVYGLRRSTRNIWAVIASAIGGVGIVWIWLWQVLNSDGSFSSVAPWIAVAWTAVAGVAIAYSGRRRRAGGGNE